jgi:hypothetical protein
VERIPWRAEEPLNEFVDERRSSVESSSSSKSQPATLVQRESLTMADLLQCPRLQIIKAPFYANGDPSFLHPPK